MLTLTELSNKLNSRTKIEATCSCGRVTTLLYGNLSKTATCGKCSFKSKEYWKVQKWGHLSLLLTQCLPEEWSLNSHQKFYFQCNCGRSTHLKFQAVTTGNSTTCGKCSFKSRKFWLTRKWGSLTLVDDFLLSDEWGAGSNKKFKFRCDCGNGHEAVFQNVTKGVIKSCGKCNHKSRDFWYSQQWGSLRLCELGTFPSSLPSFSMKKFKFACKCGKSAVLQFSHVTQGFMKTCGRCSWKSREFWEGQKWGNLTLVKGKNVQLEISPMSNHKLKFLCKCGKEGVARFADVNDGSMVSCGCLQIGQNEFSKENELRLFVISLAPDTLLRPHSIIGTRKSYDVYVPSAKLAIEYHGLNWHSEQFKRGQQDEHKFILAKSRGDRLIQIYSDEWRDKQEIIKAQLREILAPEKKIRIKPTFEIYTKTPPEARAFLDAHHYLGAAGGCITVVARHGGAVVGVWVFMKREVGVILWHRACWHHAYKAWNPHEKALKLALPELRTLGFTRMVTFSDNRFHTGELYEKLGFTFEGNIQADYGYTNGVKRVSKYNLRVLAGTPETIVASTKGWYKIWDSGKRRYALSL